jgi:DNA primase
MANIIPNEEINNIRNNTNIVDVISSYINLEPKGKNYFGICPFHNDHNPSLSVSPDKQIYTCFVCGNTGNVFTFVQNYENVSFLESVKIVADKIGYNLKYDIETEKPHKRYYDMIDLANKYYINNLNSKLGLKAKEYLIKERKLSEDIIKEFKIGLALNDNKLNKLLLNKGYTEEEIINVSLANKGDNLLDLFRNRITFPINNDKGDLVAFSARIYNGESESKYINSRENIIFKKGNILYNYDKCKLECSKTKTVILVEGQIDAIRVYSNGVKNVCAEMGTALTKEHIALLKKLNSKVIMVLDNDAAGEKSTLANGEALINSGIDVQIVRLSGDKDPDTYILDNGIEAFKNAINNAISYFDFKINLLKKNKDFNKSDELAEYINNVINELNKSDDEILKEITINKLSTEYGIAKNILENKIIHKVQAIPKIEVKINKPKISKYGKIAEALLLIMLSDSKYIVRYEKELNYIPEKEYRLIANDILAFYKTHGEINIADFITYVSSFKYKDTIMRIINNGEPQYSEFDNYIIEIKKWLNENEIENVKEEIKKETDINRKEELMNLIIKLKRRSEENEKN